MLNAIFHKFLLNFNIVFIISGERISSFDKNELPNPYEHIMEEFCESIIASRKLIQASKQMFQGKHLFPPLPLQKDYLATTYR